MEKFAVDLDKVLDEFEFNEDRAEQIASIGTPTTHGSVVLPGKTNQTPQSYNHSSPHTVITSLERQKDVQPINLEARNLLSKDKINDVLNIQKSETSLETADSVNHFCMHDHANDNKITEKQSVEPHDSEPVPLTIHNNISQKLLQKKQNENTSSSSCSSSSSGSSGGMKIQNSYDKKLNQPNIKPSVSNVFNSLNEYINAPSVSFENESNSEPNPNQVPKPEESMKPVSSGYKEININKKPPELEPNEEQRNDAIQEKKLPPKYQNILLPVKLDSCVTINDQSSDNQKIDNVVLDETIGVSSKDPLYKNVTLPEPSSNAVPSLIDRPEPVYENVYIGTDIPKTHEIYATVNKPKGKSEEVKKSDEVKHTYENVDLPQGNPTNPQSSTFDKKEMVYECIYIGGNSRDSGNLPETTTELEVAAKKITGQLFGSKGNAVPQSASSHKPIGFSNIDDLSEEELNKYLAELEAEEKTNEEKAVYGNAIVAGSSRENSEKPIFPASQAEDEDENEAPIFESVTIGELPSVSEEELQAKAKKFPVIDYSKSGTSSDMSSSTSDFLEKKASEKFQEPVKIASDAKETKTSEKRSKKVREVYEKSSDDLTEDADESPLVTSEVTSDVSEARSKPEENDDKSQGKLTKEVSSDSDSLPVNSVTSSEKNEEDEKGTETEAETVPVTENIGSSSSQDETLCENNCSSSSYDTKSNEEEVSCENNSLSKNSETLNEGQMEFDENADDVERPSRPQTLDIVSTVDMDEHNTIGSPGTTPGVQERQESLENNVDAIRRPSPDVSDNSSMESGTVLGKQPPFWVPDSDAPNCMLCDLKFSLLKRRHHCRACGKVLCSKCCNMKYRLEYQGNIDSRVCLPCYQLLIKGENEQGSGDWTGSYSNNACGSDINSPQGRQPNPNNPMEYCSTIPPLQQLAGGLPPPPTVMVPVGVLKREGSTKQRPEGQKSVMFSDGIRPGCDLTELDSSWDLKPPYRKLGNKRIPTPGPQSSSTSMKKQNLPPLDPNTNSYIPQDPNVLPPTVTIHKGQITYHEVIDENRLNKTLRNECEPPVMFAVNKNLYAYVKVTNLNCCVNRICWNVTSRGLACVGQDEVIFLVETLPDEDQIPRDLLVHINQLYVEAIKGNTVTELGVSIHQGGQLMGSREHAGFLFIRQTFQCLQKVVLPPAPFLVGLLVHRWETPWAKVFPLRLVLRLGAEYRYYPCPLVSVRFRDAVYFEIGHTVMKILADFRNFTYTLPCVRGLTVHIQDRTTDVMFPKNRYDQVIKGLNNSNDHVLAYASNFSILADSHLVCIQTNSGDESSYQTQAINIHNKPRKVTGASFVVINGALKSSMGLCAKSSIVEDGLMVQIMPEKMEALKAALKNMQDFSIGCGRQGAPEPDETVNIKWVDNDVQFNLGVKSPIDGKAMDGIPSIRVHNGSDYRGSSRFIRWTEVFIIKSDDHPNGVHDPVDINKLSESIARATCAALVKLLDLLATAGLTKLAVRTTIHLDNVGYEAGSEGTRLPPIYMNSLDNELIQVLHKAAQNSQDTHTVLELIFHILDD